MSEQVARKPTGAGQPLVIDRDHKLRDLVDPAILQLARLLVREPAVPDLDVLCT